MGKENKRRCQISGHGSLKYLRSGRLRESAFETLFDSETNWLFPEWSLMGGGCFSQVWSP